MDYDNLLDLVKRRRIIRRFKPDPIPDERIEQMIEVARWAPSGFNMQPWEFVVVKKPELRDKIVEYIKTYWAQSKSMEVTREPWQGNPGRLPVLLMPAWISQQPLFLSYYLVIREPTWDSPWG